MAQDASADGGDPTVSGSGVDFDLDIGEDRTAVDPEAQRKLAANPPLVSSSGNHAALPVGTTLQEYTLEAVLGTGGFGITYLARDNNLQCRVAIKEYLPGDLAVRLEGSTVCPRTESDTHGFRLGLDRFLAETRVLASFRHPNIVRVVRFFEANNTAYMVMDYERGESLRAWLPGHSPVDEADLLRMFLPLLEGLDVVHKGGVLHRDIKPANIYVRDGDGSLVLLDFGAARHADGGTSRSLTSIVTPGYAPFEQYHTHGAQGPWSDIYALGGVLYWLVTGEKPLEAPSRVKQDAMPKAAVAAAGRYSEPFLAAIDWALTTDEERRPRSVAEFRAALTGERPAVASATASPPTAAPVPKKRSWLPAGLAVAVLVAALGGYLALRGEKTVEPESAKSTVAEAAPKAHKAVEKSPAKTHAEKPAKIAAGGSGGSGGMQATLTFEIVPDGETGEVLIDGKKVGVAPPLRELKVAAGKHKVEIRRLKWPGVYYFPVDLQPAERKNIWVRLEDNL